MVIPVLAPVAGLPVGPATEASVKDILNIELDDDRDDAKLGLNINAANRFVTRLRVVKSLTADVDGWPHDIALGATLLAARWSQRSNSPAGIIELGGDAGVAYVQRNDPDIAMMLGLGPYTRPACG